MALTKKDVLKISELINQSFEYYFTPLMKLEMKQLQDSVKEQVSGLRKDTRASFSQFKKEMNSHVGGLAQQIRKTNENIGYYFNKCVTSKKFSALEKKVLKLKVAMA